MFIDIAGGICYDFCDGVLYSLLRCNTRVMSSDFTCVSIAIWFGDGQKSYSGVIQGDVLATDNNTVGMGDAGIKSAIQGSNVPNPDEAVPSFVSGAMAKAGKGLL